MRMIVLEDEPIIRQGLIHKIRSGGLPIEIVGEAGDGIAGLELVRALQPDAVMTDIEMPGMSGLAFISEARAIAPALEFVIVSGYDNFDYAQQAIRYGVSRYLLKPLEDQELYETLSELAGKQDAGQALERYYRELRTLEASSREALRQQELTQFLQGEDAAIADERLQALAAQSERFTAAVLLLEPFSLPHGSFLAGEEELLSFAIKNIVTEQFEVGGIRGVLIHHSLHRREFVYAAGLSAGQDRAAVGQALERILYGIRSYLKLQATAGIGSLVGSLPRIGEAYHEAKQAARGAVLHGAGRYYLYDDKARLPNRKSILGDEDRTLVSAWLERREADKLHRWIDRRIGAVAQDPASVYVQLAWFVQDLFLLYHEFMLTRTEDVRWTLGEMNDVEQSLERMSEWRDAAELLKRLTDNVIGYLSHSGTLADRDMMEAIRGYIDVHYGEALSLQSIAQQFYLHPNYLSNRFKEKFGVSFVDYATAVRMKQATALLRHTGLKVHQIAERVGYDDPAYFGSVFRKTFGMTPKMYREHPPHES
ncbi:helix-turn-helix domain-containing protein [Cohnella fermenti]|uniref:Helix-turn-helix domain-containing protein n=1 Tax=Cohnella fermenti TaxID=2565925 RepID=A0A4S4BJY6_9BACL|nr:helix-turn-helix domain-containing protein [Cohnella fermenti]THF75010.1 helix-turn-helix domain-containing protein [Cohnella fermenti]